MNLESHVWSITLDTMIILVCGIGSAHNRHKYIRCIRATWLASKQDESTPCMHMWWAWHHVHERLACATKTFVHDRLVHFPVWGTAFALRSPPEPKAKAHDERQPRPACGLSLPREFWMEIDGLMTSPLDNWKSREFLGAYVCTFMRMLFGIGEQQAKA